MMGRDGVGQDRTGLGRAGQTMMAKMGSSRKSNLRHRALSAAGSMMWAVSSAMFSWRLSASSALFLVHETASSAAGRCWESNESTGSDIVAMSLMPAKKALKFEHYQICATRRKRDGPTCRSRTEGKRER